ncbi:MAG: hypothetical protein M0P31_06135 [Solirubrobacteraceae bacterium]|nr:hypothetical protein [Solirubrobacteraceae bacterium]
MRTSTSSRPVRRLALAALAAVVATVPAGTGTAIAAPERAHPADAIVDSIGVTIHLRFEGTEYDHRFDRRFADGAPSLRSRLRRAGIRHVRDEMPGQTSSFHDTVLRRHAQLGNDGIRTTMIWDPALGVGSFPTAADCPAGRPCHTVDGALRRIRRLQAADAEERGIPKRPLAVEAIEGPNETDGRAWSFAGRPFPAGTASFQAALHRAVKGNADPEIAALPVIAPSVAVPERVDALGDLSPSCDLGNMHSYPGGGTPTHRLDAGLRGRADGEGHIALARSGCPGRPVAATETGYLYGVNDPATGHPHVPERAGAKYILRMIFEYARRGVARTMLYELLDSSPQRFGLIAEGGRARPAYAAVRNLIDLLDDPGRSFAPESLDLAVDADRPTVHHLLLQRRDGTFWLALWNDVPSTQSGAWGAILDRDSSAGVRVALPTGVREARVYRPSQGVDPIRTVRSPTSLALQAPDDVLLVRIDNGRRAVPARPSARTCPRPSRRAKAERRRDRSAARALACRRGA